MIRKASKKIQSLLDRYCSNEAIERLTGNGFMTNLMQNFNDDFNTYLYNNYHVQILSYSTVAEKLGFKPKAKYSPDDLCVYNADQGKYRFVFERDAGTIQSLIKKWYQCSDEINLRIALLFNSKLGSKYLAKKSHVPEPLISKARHGHISINQLSAEHRLDLENVYMNSKFAQHLRQLHIVLTA